MLESEWKGAPLSVEVGPAAVNGKYAVVRLVLSTTSDEKVSISQPFGPPKYPATMVSITMLSLDKGLVYRELNVGSHHMLDGLKKGEPLELYPVFRAPNEGVDVVELHLPQVGVAAGIPVVKDAQTDFSVNDVVSKAELDDSDPGPFKIETVSLAADGSSDTKQDEKSTTVTVAGDVTFAVDSDQLSAQADAVLAGVVEQIRNYPSGGDLTITGHTDDVADDAYNQDLSERRAKAVAERLKTLTDLSKWKQSVSGKGESSPRMPNDSEENKQSNRRVEITLKPSKPSENSSAPEASVAPSSTALPGPAGPVGKGPEGVDVTVDGKSLHMSVDHVVRIGEYLTGSVELSSDQEVSIPAAAFALPEAMQKVHGGWVIGGVYSLTLLSGSTRYMEADCEPPGGDRLPVAMTSFGSSVTPGVPVRLPVVWPDPGGDSVTIDLPEGETRLNGRIVARLTDIPVMSV